MPYTRRMGAPSLHVLVALVAVAVAVLVALRQQQVAAEAQQQQLRMVLDELDEQHQRLTVSGSWNAGPRAQQPLGFISISHLVQLVQLWSWCTCEFAASSALRQRLQLSPNAAGSTAARVRYATALRMAARPGWQSKELRALAEAAELREQPGSGTADARAVNML